MNQIVRVSLCIAWAVFHAQAVEIQPVTDARTKRKFTIAKIDLRTEKLELFLNDTEKHPIKSFERLQAMLETERKALVFAMNAGMYHGDFSPVGLFVSEGKVSKPLNLDNGQGNFFLKPNGVFLVSDKGAQVVTSTEYPLITAKVFLATQSGPLLLRNNHVHPVFKADSKNRLYRNGVGIRSSNEVIFAISEETVTFYEFATFFRDAMKCADALFLDGTVSSMFSEQPKRSDRKMDLGPIIGVTRPK